MANKAIGKPVEIFLTIKKNYVYFVIATDHHSIKEQNIDEKVIK